MPPNQNSDGDKPQRQSISKAIWGVMVEETMLSVLYLLRINGRDAPKTEEEPPKPKGPEARVFARLDFYQVLDVSDAVDSDELKRAYRKKALEHHPDKNPDDVEQANKRFARVHEAYETLKDNHSRAHYDMLRSNNLHLDPESDDEEPDTQDDESTKPVSQPEPMFVTLWDLTFWLGIGILLIYQGYRLVAWTISSISSKVRSSSPPPEYFYADNPGSTSHQDQRPPRAHPFIRFCAEDYRMESPKPYGATSIQVTDLIAFLMSLQATARSGDLTTERWLDLVGNLFECIAIDEYAHGLSQYTPLPKFGDMSKPWCASDLSHLTHGLDSEQKVREYVAGLQAGTLPKAKPPYAKEFYTHWCQFRTTKDFSWVRPYTQYHVRDPEGKNRQFQRQLKGDYERIIKMFASQNLQSDPRRARFQRFQLEMDAIGIPVDLGSGGSSSKKDKKKKKRGKKNRTTW